MQNLANYRSNIHKMIKISSTGAMITWARGIYWVTGYFYTNVWNTTLINKNNWLIINNS